MSILSWVISKVVFYFINIGDEFMEMKICKYFASCDIFYIGVMCVFKLGE